MTVPYRNPLWFFQSPLSLLNRPLAPGMIISTANRARRRQGGGVEELTMEDVQAWIFWRQLHPPEGVPPEPEPEPLDAKFKIKLGFGGRPADAAAQLSPAEYTEEFHVVVCDDRGLDHPRSITVWRLGGAADADTAVSTGVLHGSRAVRCHHPPGSFKLELANMPANIPDGQERSGSYFFLPGAHQSSEELVAFFNRCGVEPPRVWTYDGHGPGLGRAIPAQQPARGAESMPHTPSNVRHTWAAPSVASGDAGSERALRGFEAPEIPAEQPQIARADVPVLSTKIIGTEEGMDPAKGSKVTHYLVECTPIPGQGAAGWIVRKRYSQFDEFRKELESADSSSEATTLGLNMVSFPAKTWGIGAVGQGTVEQRQQKLEEWLNKIVGLNNALLCSDHRELADAVCRFLRPQNDSMPLTMEQLQAAGGAPMQSDAVRRERELLAQQVTKESWRADQITGEDGYLHTFEQQLFPSLSTPDDGEDRIVQELQQVLASVGSGEGGKLAKSEVDRLVKSLQAELRVRDETISQLTRQRECVDSCLSLSCAHSERRQLSLRTRPLTWLPLHIRSLCVQQAAEPARRSCCSGHRECSPSFFSVG